MRMVKILQHVVLMTILFPALMRAQEIAPIEHPEFFRKPAVEGPEIGPARRASQREHIVRPQNMIGASRAKRVQINDWMLGLEWNDYSSYLVYTYVSYNGAPEHGAFVVEHRSTGEFKRFELRTQMTEITASSGAWGIISDVPDGTKEMYRYALITRLGRYLLSVEVDGRTVNRLPFDVQVILDPYACYLGAGTDLVVVEFYASYFDKPPQTDSVRVLVGGREVNAQMHRFEKGVVRIDLVMTQDEYREIFNESSSHFDWIERVIRVDTDSKVSSVQRTLAFPPPLEVPHC